MHVSAPGHSGMQTSRRNVRPKPPRKTLAGLPAGNRIASCATKWKRSGKTSKTGASSAQSCIFETVEPDTS